jgi:hypothetical protein
MPRRWSCPWSNGPKRSSSASAPFANGARHFYDVYDTSDGRYVSVGALEPACYKNLVERLWAQRRRGPVIVRAVGLAEPQGPTCGGLPDEDPRRMYRHHGWCRSVLRSRVPGRRGTSSPHNTACGTFVEIDGRVQPTPAPRFSRTPPGLPAKLPRAGERTVTALLEWSRRVSAQSSTLITGFLPRPVRARISGRSVKCRDGWLIRRCFSHSCAGLRRDRFE